MTEDGSKISHTRRAAAAAAMAAACRSRHVCHGAHGLNDSALVPHVFDYAQAMLAAAHVLAPPPTLTGHVYERYLPPPDQPYQPLVQAEGNGGGLERLDPVCLMDVDSATARHTVEYEGRVIAFCAPSCKKQFLADPEAYLIA